MNKNSFSINIIRTIIISIIIVSAFALIASAVVSLNWRYYHDTPIMIYCAYLIDSGFIPYRDFFEMNMPGIYFINLLAAKIFGWSDLSFRIFDILYLCVLSLFTFFWLKPLGKLTAASGVLLFGLYYLNENPYLILQREYIALLPFAVMLWLIIPKSKLSEGRTLFLSGILISLSFLIKPQFILLSLPAIGFFIYENRLKLSFLKQLKYLATGLVIPVIVFLLYLIITGSLNSFFDIVYNYWYLYSDLNGDHRILEGYQKITYDLKSLFSGLNSSLLPLALMGILILSYEKPKNKYILLLFLQLIASAVYPVISGQYFDYHWIPFHYIALCTAANLVQLPAQKLNAEKFILFIAAMLLFAPLLKSNLGFTFYYSKKKEKIEKERFLVADEITEFLNNNLKAGDKVQPLDWSGGAIHAMLRADAKIATRFIYDFQFYHHINSPYINRLKKEFMDELVKSKPEYIIQILENKPWPIGENTSRNFEELEDFINKNYYSAKEGPGFKIYKHYY
ncbi:MAG TPA: glycosyltransferase family 39 protein [Ignavibacteria bacterium]|nr:glycosyltransferase family 39 protein [Ignavibacteria bacterium]